MLKTFSDTAQMIADGKLLHIAGTESLIKQLPKGNWIGGSTEYFMSEDGGKVSNELLFVDVLAYNDFKISSYCDKSISDVALDAYDNGFSILIIPFDSELHKSYAKKAASFDGMFIKNIVGWISGVNLSVPGQTPIAVNGMTGEAFNDKAVALHISVPADKTVNVGIINIFEQDKSAPVIEFDKEDFRITNCRIDGKEVILADYIEQNALDTKLPLVGEYSGAGINISFKTIENGIVNFYAPVFPGIQYRMAKSIPNYEMAFNERLAEFKDAHALFSCNCILNFLYGEFEGKDINTFTGPITFGEIAYQLVNQTLVYITII